MPETQTPQAWTVELRTIYYDTFTVLASSAEEAEQIARVTEPAGEFSECELIRCAPNQDRDPAKEPSS